MSNGILKGANQKNLEIAKKMKNKKIDTNIIIEITGLTEEEVEKL